MAGIRRRGRSRLRVGMPQMHLQPQLQLQPVANLDDGTSHKLGKEFTEEELRRSSEQQEIDDKMSNFEKVKV